MGAIKVYLADDHAVFRTGLRLLLDAPVDIEVVGEGGDGAAVLEYLQSFPVDVVIMDLSMPGLDGIQATKGVRDRYPRTHVIVLSAHEEAAFLRQVFRFGASGFVPKRQAFSILIEAIRSVASGKMFIDASTTARAVSAYLSEEQQSPGYSEIIALSERETRVLKKVAMGYSNREIGERLALSVKTVETNKARFMKKLGLTNRVEIIRYAVKAGWLEVN